MSGGATVVMVDRSLVASLDKTIREARETAPAGSAIRFLAENAEVSAAVDAALKRVSAGALLTVEARPELFIAEDGVLQVSLARLSSFVVSDGKLAGRSIGRIIASGQVVLDSSDLAESDPLRAAVFVVLSALGPAGFTAGQLDRIGEISRLLSSQA